MTGPGRNRARRGPASSSLLRRSWIRLLPAPGQAIGLAVLVAALTAALVSAPLFVASAEAGAWDRQRDRLGETALGATVSMTTASRRGEVVPGRIRAVDDLDAGVAQAARSVGLGAPTLAAVLRNLLAGTVGARTEAVEVVSLPDVSGFEIVAGAPSDDGVLVAEPLVERAAFGPGTSITLTGVSGTVVLPVSGVFVLPAAPSAATWGGLRSLVPPSAEWTGQPVSPTSVVLAPAPLALDAAAALDEDLDMAWSIPLPESTGISGARATADRFDALQAALLDPDGPFAGVPDADVGSALVRTPLPDALEAADRTSDLLTPPVRAVGTGAAGAALVLVGAWTAARVRSRDDQLRALVARGMSPLRAAGDAVREACLPVLAGVLAGAAFGWLLVRVLGPADRLPPGAPGGAVTAALGGLAAALLVVAAVTAALVTRLYQADRGQAAQLLGRVPWLAVATTVTVLAVARLLAGGREDGGRIDALTLATPLLVTLVVAGAVTALLPRLGRRTGARLRRLPPAPYLALRRVVAGRSASRLAVVTTALSLGLVVYAGALATSTDRTLAAKAAVASGSDVVVPLAQGQPVEELPLWQDATVVFTGEGAAVGAEQTDVDVLALRPDEVAGVVRWDAALAQRPLSDLMGALADYDGDRVPVVLAGGSGTGGPDDGEGALTLDLGPVDVPVEVVARAEAFPGQPGRRPMLVADLDRIAAAVARAGSDVRLLAAQELWSRGDTRAVVDLLPSLGIVLPDRDAVRTAAAFAGRPEVAAQVWSLDYLRAVALGGSVLGLAGVAVHAAAQQRRRTVAALLLARMGMRRRSSDAAAGLEIGLLAAVAAVVALAVALPASGLVLRLLDPVPDLRPDVLFRVPWGSIGAVVAGVLLVTATSALVVGRTARRTDGGQVLRDAE